MIEIIYFVNNPLLKRDLDLYGVNFFNSKGIKIQFYIVFYLITPNVQHKSDCDYPYQETFHSWKVLKNKLKEKKNTDTVFISDIPYGPAVFKFYFTLSSVGINYHFVDNWYTVVPPQNFRNDVLYPLIHANLFSIPARTFKFINGKIKNKIFKAFLKKPETVFYANHNSSHGPAIKGKNSKIIPYCSFDFDSYLDFVRGNLYERPSVEGNYFVFIDQFMTGHPDFARNGKLPPVTKEKYYPGLNHFCNRLSAQLNMKYVVAIHPRRTDETLNDFDTPYVFTHKTFQLIKNAKLVLLQYSTAINWAILFNKPIIFITSDELENSKYGSWIKLRSSLLNLPVINVDDDEIDFNEIEHLINCNDFSFKYNQFKINNIVYDVNNQLKTYEIIYKIFFLASGNNLDIPKY